MSFDTLAGLSLALMLVIVAFFFIIIYFNFHNIENGTERLNILNARLAIFLPLYAIFMWIGVMEPEALPVMDVLMTIVESYTFYCFFALLVTNFNGPTTFVEVLKTCPEQLACCNCIMPKDKEILYTRTVRALFHFVFTRNILSFVNMICQYTAHPLIGGILQLAMFVILFWAVIHVILTFENVYKNCPNLFGLMKATLIKVSVGWVVIQGIVKTFLISSNKEPYEDDDEWSSEEKTERGYCALMLIEFAAIFSLPYLYAFTKKITASKYITDNIKAADSSSSSSSERAPLTFGDYLCRTFAIVDIFNTLHLENSTLKQPLQGQV